MDSLNHFRLVIAFNCSTDLSMVVFFRFILYIIIIIFISQTMMLNKDANTALFYMVKVNGYHTLDCEA